MTAPEPPPLATLSSRIAGALTEFKAPSRVRSALAGAVIATLMLSGPSPARVGAAPAARTDRAYDFLDRIGVGAHLAYTDSDYVRVHEVIDDLRYLGVKHVRDNNLDSRNQGQANFGAVAAAGFKFDLIVSGGRTVEQSLAWIHMFEQQHPGAMAAIEGPNEINNFPVVFGDLKGAEAAVALQSALYKAVKADPLLKDTPVYSFTSWPEFRGEADFANYHSYPKAGAQPLDQLTHDFRGQSAVMPGKPMVLTEAGYYSLPNRHGWGGVDEATQARLLLNLIMDASRLEVRRVYIYQLLDAYPDPDLSDQERHFGLFTHGNRRKLAADAIHNLTALLADPAPEAASFRTQSLPYRVSGLSPAGSSLVLQKASGAFVILVWDEPRIWDNDAHAPIPVTPRPVVVDLGRSFAEAAIYDPLVGTNPIKTFNNVSRVEAGVSDHPLLIELR